jgi:hypothetical protein
VLNPVVKDKWQETKKWLEKVQEEHENTKMQLDEEIALRKYHEQYGDKMEKLATETISTLQTTVKDNDGLFSKLGMRIPNMHYLRDFTLTLTLCVLCLPDRQRKVQDSNQAALQDFKGDFDAKARHICNEMLQFRSTIYSMQSDLESKAKEYAEVLQKVCIFHAWLCISHSSLTRCIAEFIHYQQWCGN